MSLDQELITKNLLDWLVDFVEKPSPLLNGWAPCPYARQARVNNKFEIVFSPHTHLFATVEQVLHKLEDKDVIVICFDHTKIPAVDLENMVKVYNEKVLLNRNYVVLEDHPDDEELLNGVKMNFGHCGLLLLSKLTVLNEASDQLRAKGYYDHWPKENIDNVVTWRYNN